MDEFSSGLSEQQLKYGYWYASNQIMVQRVLLAIAWVIIGIMLVFSLYNLVDWALLGGMRERALVVSMQNPKADFASAKEQLRPRDLAVTNTVALPAGDGKVDFVSKVKNQNAGWGAMMDYVFSYGSAETPVQRGFVLPNEETWLTAYAIPDTGAVQPIFRAKEIRWMRVPPHEVGPYAPFADARLRFDIIAPQNVFVDFGGKNITKTTFTIVNRSSYSYWHVPLIITLDQNGTPAAMQTVVLDQLKAGESRSVEASWFYDVPSSAIPVITPHVNLLDPSAYMQISGQAPSTDIREETIQELQ